MTSLTLNILHEDFPDKRWQELRFLTDTTISQLKTRLHHYTGTSPESMNVYVIDEGSGGGKGSWLMDDTKTLTDYNVSEGMTLLVVDTDPQSLTRQIHAMEGLPDTKYKMDDEVYGRRTDSARVFLANLRQGKPELFAKTVKRKDCEQIEHHIEEAEQIPHEMTEALRVGTRCELKNLGGVRGEIRWLGKRHQMNGLWIGVLLDEPVGSFNGKDRDVQLFECPSKKYGHLLQINPADWSSVIAVGCYPPVNPLDVDEI